MIWSVLVKHNSTPRMESRLKGSRLGTGDTANASCMVQQGASVLLELVAVVGMERHGHSQDVWEQNR